MSPSEPTSQDADPNAVGCSPRTAIPVGSVGEEYAWVAKNRPGARLVGQRVTDFEGVPLDVLTLGFESGDRRQVYFDISWFYGRDRRARSSVAPCPYCGAALRTERAKQCFECRMNWHDAANVIQQGGT
jgi:hypothetical protein